MDAIVLPSGARLVRTTPEFDRSTAPAGLLRAHVVADGVWGQLVVRSGALRFVFEDEPGAGRAIVAPGHQVIPPGRPHHLELDGDVRFAVEFHRLDDPV